jgi:2'-phosphotransferase
MMLHLPNLKIHYNLSTNKSQLIWHRLKSLKVTFEDIQEVVADNAKQRFSLKPNPKVTPAPLENDTDPSHWLIRANQGHSIDTITSSALLSPITLAADNIPPIVVHGTFFSTYPLIINSGGLKKMGRNHVHFSTGLPEDKQGVISGMRSDAEILVYVDVRKSVEDGMEWWISDNGVVLTEGNEEGLVPTKYFTKVEGRKQDVGILWEDGVQVAELNTKGKRAPKQLPRSQREKAKREEEKGKAKLDRRTQSVQGGNGDVGQVEETLVAEAKDLNIAL